MQVREVKELKFYFSVEGPDVLVRLYEHSLPDEFRAFPDRA